MNKDKFELNIKAYMDNSYQQWKFWEEVVKLGTYRGLNKTHEDAIKLCSYYEGEYEMTKKFRQLFEELER